MFCCLFYYLPPPFCCFRVAKLFLQLCWCVVQIRTKGCIDWPGKIETQIKLTSTYLYFLEKSPTQRFHAMVGSICWSSRSRIKDTFSGCKNPQKTKTLSMKQHSTGTLILPLTLQVLLFFPVCIQRQKWWPGWFRNGRRTYSTCIHTRFRPTDTSLDSSTANSSNHHHCSWTRSTREPTECTFESWSSSWLSNATRS